MFSATSHAESNFTATLSSNKVELGKTLTLLLSAPDAATKLNNIDLTSVETFFHINTSADIELSDTTNKQSWKLHLTPYKTGGIELAPLFFNGEHSKPLSLSVTDSFDKKTGTPINLLTHVSSQDPWTREQVLFSVDLQTSIPRAQIKLGTTPVTGAVIEQLDVHHKVNYKDAHSPHHYKTGWALFPLTSGKVKINLPPVELIRDGVTTHRFYLAPLELNVQALPLYIPATIPVGRIELTSERTIKYLLQNNLDEYKLSLTGQNMLLTNLPDITSQITSNRSIRIYPETTNATQTNTHKGIMSQINYTIPVKALNQGYSGLDDIRLTYFDPVSGTLKVHNQSNLILLSVNKWLAWLFTILTFTLVMYVLFKLIQWLLKFREKIIAYSTAITSLQSPCTPEELKASISLMSSAEGYSTNVTLQSWFDTINYARPSSAFTEELSRLLYMERPAEIPLHTREKILRIAFSNIPIVRWFHRTS